MRILRENSTKTCSGSTSEFQSKASDLDCGVAEGFGAFVTGTDAAQMVVCVDAGGVTVRKRDLNGVIPYLRGGFGPRLGLEHGQRR